MVRQKFAGILRPGGLQQKYEEIAGFLSSGSSLLYSGSVAWKITLPDAVRDGEAESVDHALAHIRALLEEALRDTPPAAKIAVAIRETEKTA
jgi:hypothetical protein